MDEKRDVKNNNRHVIILILVIAVLALAFYIIVDKKVSKSDNNDTESNTVEKNDYPEEIEKDVMSDDEALKLGDELWKYAHSAYWGQEPAWHSNRDNPGNLLVCTTTKDEVKTKFTNNFVAAMKSYSSENSDYKMDVDEFITNTPCSGGRGSVQDYKTTTLAVKEIQKNKIIYTAKSEYCGSSFCIESNETIRTVEKDFIIEKDNDNWLISYFYLPN